MEAEDLTSVEGEAAGFIQDAGLDSPQEWTPPRIFLTTKPKDHRDEHPDDDDIQREKM